MWVILQNNAGWDCFKTPISQEILRIQNPLLEEHYVFLEVILWFQKVGCVLETNFSFAQFNRIRNHLFGRWIEIGRDSRSRFMGSDCFSPWKHNSDP